MENIDETDSRKRLLPGQFTMTDALTRAIEVAAEAYRTEAYQEEWPEEDRKALNVPARKDPSRRR